MRTPPHDRLLAFYSGVGHDDRGRTFEDVLAFDVERLEFAHDYIQWLFPLLARSGANPSAPVLDQDSVAAFRRDQHLRRQVRRALEMMLRFYGLELTVGGTSVTVVRADSFDERSRVWLTPRNHNFLRLTRIMRSLAILQAGPLSRALLACLLEIAAECPGVVSEKTIDYWRESVPP